MVAKWNYDHWNNQCDYRTTIKETTRVVRRLPGQRTASESSQEEENIPRMEKFIDNSFIYLASGYDWQNGTHSGSLKPKYRSLEPPPDAKGVNDGGAAPEVPAVPHHHGPGGAGQPVAPISFTPVPSSPVPSTLVPSTLVPSRFAYQGPDPKLPRFTMLWSWSAHPQAPRQGSFDAKKLEEIREHAVEVIRESKRLRASYTAIHRLVPRAQRIIQTIDDFNGGSVDDANIVEPPADLNDGPSEDLTPDDLIDPLENGDDGVDDDRNENERQKKRPRKL